MSALEIKTAGNPVLRQVAAEVTRFDKKLGHFLKNMAETMVQANGCGLAAPQVGISKRIIVVDVGEGVIELINPVIVVQKGSCVLEEGCLSVPDFVGEVERANFVSVNFYDRKGQKMNIEGEGLLAVALQHEIDHLNGVLFVDKAKSLSHKE
ncbi:MAG: peptide deformylase [Acidaminococcaceae bacterium]